MLKKNTCHPDVCKTILYIIKPLMGQGYSCGDTGKLSDTDTPYPEKVVVTILTTTRQPPIDLPNNLG